MMNDNLYKKAYERTVQDLRRLQEVKPLPEPRSLTEVSKERLEEKEWEKIAPRTGYPELDAIIIGFVPGHLYTLTGDVNIGKTSLCTNFADRVSRQGKRVLYFALEPENTVVDYLASVRLDKKFPDLTPEDLAFDDGMVHIYGKAEISQVDDLVTIVRDSEIHYDLIIIDHIGYFIRSQNNWLQEQSNVIKKLAGLAKEKKTAVMMVAHLRKKGFGQKKDYIPTSDDISGSGSFKQDSTEVMIVVRKFKSDDPESLQYADRGKLYVTKNKVGPNGSVDLLFSERKANIVSEAEANLLETVGNWK